MNEELKNDNKKLKMVGCLQTGSRLRHLLPSHEKIPLTNFVRGIFYPLRTSMNRLSIYREVSSGR